jgi:hypothetical protein
MMGTDEEGLKPPFTAGRLEFRHVEFRYVKQSNPPFLLSTLQQDL